MKILILSCSTGEGHNSAGFAVMEELTSRGIECEFMDPIRFKSEKRMKGVSALYNNCISHIPWFFGIVYKAGQLYDWLRLPSPVAYANSKYAKQLADYIVENKFDAVVSPHLFAMQAMVSVRENHGVKIPTHCIVTDYTLIPFHKDSKSLDYQFASSKDTADKLLKLGFDEKKIVNIGIPVSPKFALSITKSEARAKLSIPEDKKVIMILSGGAGCGRLSKLCRKLRKNLGEGHLIYVFPGKNEKLSEKLKTSFADTPDVKVVDFTREVHIYMKAADVVLSKPGGLSSTEIASANVPFVHLKPIPGCESYNIRYFTKNGMSLAGRSIGAAVKATAYLLSNDEAREKMLAAQRALINPRSAELTVNKILKDLT